MKGNNFTSVSDYDLLPSVRAFLSKTLLNCIDGEWVGARSGKTFEKRDPATDEVVANVTKSGPEDVDLAVASARRAFENPMWRNMPALLRQDILLRFADLIQANKDELCQLECLDNGRSAADTMSIDGVAGMVRYFSSLQTKVYGDTMEPALGLPGGMQSHGYILRQPVGVVAAIIPWNAPMMGWVFKVIPPIALGCTVILKPARETPIIATRLLELLLEAGLPNGVMNLVEGFGEVAGAYLASHPGINKVTFTGSTEVGKSIGKAAIDNMTRLSLELGGKSPSIIFDDANMTLACQQAADTIFMNAGQICIAGSRLFVQKKKFDQAMAAIQDRAESIKVGPGIDPTNEMGPLINGKQKTRVMGYIESGLEAGARLLAGGNAIDRPGHFVQPTVFVDVDDHMKIYREEIFGPVLTARPFEDIADVVRMANDTHYGLASYVWTGDLSVAHRMARLLDAGLVSINAGLLALDPHYPFGGFKHSGIGRENGNAAIDQFTEMKTVFTML